MTLLIHFSQTTNLPARINVPVEIREKYLNNFLNYQVHLATINSGCISPDSYDEYCLSGVVLMHLKSVLNNLIRIDN